MEKVVLSKAARKALGERLGKPIPNPDSEEFDALLEELREMQPELYTDLVSALEHKGEVLPVEKEALRASRRAQRKRIADHIKNRQTHDGKQVPDKRKSVVLGGACAALLLAWIGYTNISNAFMVRAASTEVTEQATPTHQAAGAEESPFGVKSDSPDLDVDFDIPETVQVVQATPPAKAPPPPAEEDEPKPAVKPAPEPPQAESPLPFGLGRTLEPPQDEPEDELPPVPGPPQPGVASAPTTSPYLAAQPGATPTPAGEPEPLPANLSFVPLEATLEAPSATLSPEGQDDAGLPSAPGTTLAASSQDAPEQTPPPTSLSAENAQEQAPAATTLNWNESEEEAEALEKNLSFVQVEQADLSATPPTTLPPVPQVGGSTPAPPAPQGTAQAPTTEPEVTDLSALLSPGTSLQAELVTGVAAADGAAMPVIARTTGDWCEKGNCPEITWIGEASYPGTNRIEMLFSQAVVGSTVQSITATAFDSDRLPGVQASVRDAAPTAVQDVIRGAVGGASDYLDALNSRETVILRDGEIVTEQAEPDLGNYLLQRGTELFSLPTDQTSILRLAEVAPGMPFTVIYGL